MLPDGEPAGAVQPPLASRSSAASAGA